MFAAIEDGHRSASTFVSQLLHSLLLYHTNEPLAFLPALDVTPKAVAGLASLASALGQFQIDQILGLPSIQELCGNDSLDSGVVAPVRGRSTSSANVKAGDWVREYLPKWVREQQLARRHQRIALMCLLELASELFPGANRSVTSAKSVFFELASGKPACQWRSTQQILTKLRQLGTSDNLRLRGAVDRCLKHLKDDAEAEPSQLATSLHTGLRASFAQPAADEAGAPTANGLTAPKLISSQRGWSASKRRLTMLGNASAVGRIGGSGGHETAFIASLARWIETELCAQIDAPKMLPLNELWRHSDADADVLAMNSSPSLTHVLEDALKSILRKSGKRAGQSAARPISASIGDRWKRSRLSTEQARQQSTNTAGMSTYEDDACQQTYDTPPPKPGLSRKASHRSSTTPESNSQKIGMNNAGSKGSSPEGWAVATVFNVLQSKEAKSVGVLEGFEAFESHQVVVQAAKHLQLSRTELVARFALAVQDLEVMGLAVLGSKLSRGIIHKCVF
mgnify:CR=1 FL=1|eukprot:scaffold76391_cov28-Tisochrysis_lutea.AAC.2